MSATLKEGASDDNVHDGTILVDGLVTESFAFTVADLFSLPGDRVNAAEVAPRFSGTAVLLSVVIPKDRLLPEATHLRFHAVDDFAAVVPVTQLEKALFLYEQDGKPLVKGFPVRLLVPDGSSNCLNVKSVVRIEAVHDERAEDAVFGFKTVLDPSLPL